MRGVSEVIAIILILMITIAIAGLAYTFMSSTMASTTAAAASAVDTTTSSMITSFTIENMDIAKAYLRNTGQTALMNLSIYVNDEPAIFNITPSSIAAGQVGTVTIYSFIPDGATVKITSPNGFSASKIAAPCSKSVGCWKFDEASGSIAYDSSPYGITGMLGNGTNWTSGKYGSALQFDGVDDYVSVSTNTVLNPTSKITVAAFMKLYSIKSWNTLVGTSSHWDNGYWVQSNGNGAIQVNLKGVVGYSSFTTGSNVMDVGVWKYVVVTYDSSIGGRIYVDGQLSGQTSNMGSITYNSQSSYMIGKTGFQGYHLNGSIDELRIYDKAVY